ncbi:MAG: GDP/UDP-N,N'-diacetylbacillosamine 2-epimerase (hydrolyzing) [Saprospiraceae bacterium]|jgi:GDP/UDP-N,N'-diacetylbacillosamine 2-epimerase (hydrolysing)
MKVGVLTSSRADFGIYLPLLKALKADAFFDLSIIAFGTHLSNFHGYTKQHILDSGFVVSHEVESMMLTDSSEAIGTAMGVTFSKFATFWNNHAEDFDVVFCLGDRYEMFSSVMAGLPFQIKFVHIHGGEKTLGAIDNVFRHSLTHASKIHFTTTESHKNRVVELVDEELEVHNVGALSLDNIKEIDLLSINEFTIKWGVDFSKPTVLITFHPETVNVMNNENFALQLVETIEARSDLQYLITMPNADTSGTIIRNVFQKHLSDKQHVFMKENLGVQSYFSAMSHCAFLMGNTSSGILEAASFKKYVLNLGDRQKGRESGANVIHVPLVKNNIVEAIEATLKMSSFEEGNIYYNGGATRSIIEILKTDKDG